MSIVLGKVGCRTLLRTKYTARDYVQDGLVAMWDGIENAGWGVHNPNATVWKDCINGIEWTGTNTLCEDDAFVSDGSATGNIFSYSSLVGAERTRQIVIEPISISFTNDPVMGATGDRTLDFALWATRTPTFTAFYRNGQMFMNVPDTDTFVKRSLTVVNSSTFTKGFVNGVRTLMQSQYYAPQGDTRLPYSGNRIRIHAFRIYNRALSDEEVLDIQAIDQARFNLT